MAKVKLANLDEVSEQEIFDHVARHLLTQQKKSTEKGERGGCMYKNPEGLMCAAGCLISDDEYNSDMEGDAWDDLVDKGIVPPYHEDLIHCLQKIHDCREPDMWPSRLIEIAKTRGLDSSVVKI